MLLVALAFVLVPLLRRATRAVSQVDGSLPDSTSNIAVFRSAKREIEDEFARGVIHADERDAALNELSQRLVDEVPEEGTSSAIATAVPRASWWLAGVLGAMIPVAALPIYATLGAPHALNGVATAAPEPAAQSPMSDKQIVSMVDTLAEKMKQNPDDPKGWVLLARSQGSLGRFPEALAAYERAVQLLPNDSQLLADYADVAVMAQQGRFDGKPATLIQRALKLDPANMKALALAATADMRAGKRDAALVNWKKLKSLVAKDSDDSRQIDAIIAEVEGGRSNVLPASAASPAAVSPPPSSPPSPPLPVAGNANTGAAKITGKIMLAAEMAAKIAPGDTLFVFARAKQGSRMPLAILKIPAPAADKFPHAFELNDAMAMAPGMNLSSVAEVVIEARISKSGNAKMQAGDVSGVSAPVKPGTTNANVTLSTVTP